MTYRRLLENGSYRLLEGVTGKRLLESGGVVALQPGPQMNIVLTLDQFGGPHINTALTIDIFGGPHTSVVLP